MVPASVSTLFHRIVAALRHDPPRTLFFKALDVLGYRRLLLCRRSLEEPWPDAPASAGLTVEILPASACAEYVAYRPHTRASRIGERWARGHLCFAARHDGRLVATCWAATGGATIEFLACAIPLAEGEVYLFDAYTTPAFRGRGVAVVICRAQLEHFRAAGYRRAIRATVPENTPALRAHGKSGFVPFGLIRRIKVGPWQHVFTRTSPGSTPQ